MNNQRRMQQLLMLDILDLTFPRPHTQRLIAAFTGISYQAVQQIEQRALRKLRLHAENKALQASQLFSKHKRA